MVDSWIIGIGAGEHEYKIGDVKYIVSSHFAHPSEPDKETLSDRIKHFVSGDFADLTADVEKDKIDSEYVCSAAGEEDLCSRKNQN